jgi:catechol 2,3-dioxygenase-like lactoylglutathione lyase family enzyme
MIEIGHLFHIAHVVDDLGAAERFYDRVFAPEYMFRGNHSEVEGRDASLLIFADFVSEPMAPLEGDGNVARFHARFGQRLHSIALYSNSVTEIWERLHAHGVRVTDGRKLLEEPPGRVAIYTHPRDSFGILEFMSPRLAGLGGAATADDKFAGTYDPRLLGTYSPSYWRDDHPLRIRHSHITVLVRDLAAARALYVDVLEGRPLFEDERTGRDTQSLYVALGSDPVVVELARPLTDDSHEARELERNGEMIYSVTFRIDDLEAGVAHLRGAGLSPARRGDKSLWIDPAEALGAVYAFTDVDIPNDPRA